MNNPSARSILARWIAELFTAPDAISWNRIHDPPARREFLEAARVLEIEPDLVAALFRALPDLDSWERKYDELFGHSVRGQCPPYELEYARGAVFQQVDTLADIAAFYRAFGLIRCDDDLERADHFVTQWEFLALAASKESMSGNSEALTSCREAERRFLSDHAAAWMPGFLARIRRADEEGYFHQAALLMEHVLKHWCAEFEVEMGSPWLELRPIEEDDWKIECGGDRGVTPAELGPRLAAAMEPANLLAE